MASAEKKVEAGTSSMTDIPAWTHDKWGNEVEFLMSCIAMSVGLGNIWRFPYMAFVNGGGVFMIPYIVVLLLIGRPIYYMEMILGQFSSKESVKVYDFCPALRGAGGGQTIAVTCVVTFYSALMAIITFYLIMSFSAVLPWSVCQPSWNNCKPAVLSDEKSGNISSTDLFFKLVVLHMWDNIDSGIGNPDWKLTLCLLFDWVFVYIIIGKGVKTSGKFSYFLALFPYFVMIILLIRSLMLPGADIGLVYLVKPDWSKIFEPQVWYNAVTQCFFSLSVCFGNVIMYSSYNNFKHNLYVDVMVVTTLDMITSFISGMCTFSILGFLSYQTGEPIDKVIKVGTDLAFISYPLAISQFLDVPQLFSVLFFLIMLILALGSIVAMTTCLSTAIKDRFTTINQNLVSTLICVCGFSVSVVYLSPGGMAILGLVDFYGTTFIIYFLGIGELIAVVWIYGTRNFCDDIEFMLDRKVGCFWRICWNVVTPIIMIIIFIYALSDLSPLTYNDRPYPMIALICGWVLTLTGILMVPLFAILALYRRRAIPGLYNKLISSLTAREDWGPREEEWREKWKIFKSTKAAERNERLTQMSKMQRFCYTIFGY